MRIVVAFLVLMGNPVLAEEWVKVADGAIEAALNDKTVTYPASKVKQVFYASGKTLSDSGQPSWGNWRAQGAQYCSEWPPQGGWDCYDLFLSADGAKVRFVGQHGDISDGVFKQ